MDPKALERLLNALAEEAEIIRIVEAEYDALMLRLGVGSKS